jgi:hypothetical protein
MDNFFTGSHANVAHHLGKPNFELIRHDIVEPILLEARQPPSRPPTLSARLGSTALPRTERAACTHTCVNASPLI